jgi:hypothetical protein
MEVPLWLSCSISMSQFFHGRQACRAIGERRRKSAMTTLFWNRDSLSARPAVIAAGRE